MDQIDERREKLKKVLKPIVYVGLAIPILIYIHYTFIASEDQKRSGFYKKLLNN